ncbi:MAG: MliC family protein [Pseudomonadales bacterium]|nr:MliC family protein [Halioglobus sp.]MCP5129545.1 MliC family protein [Pseudomonadales bacterium]
MTKLGKVLPVCLCALLVGCSGQGVVASESGSGFKPDPQPSARTMVYDCNGFEFIARLGPGEMAIWLPDRYVVLPQVRSASGSKYQEEDIEFWSKGDEAMLTVGSQQYFNCAQMPQRVPWEDARRRGVDFRAVGNEPGWSLEIQDGRQLLFVGDYGMQRVATPDPGAQAQGDVRSWHAITESADLRVEVVEQPCADTMADEVYPSAVRVTLNGEMFQGCGRNLEYPWE